MVLVQGLGQEHSVAGHLLHHGLKATQVMSKAQHQPFLVP